MRLFVFQPARFWISRYASAPLRNDINKIIVMLFFICLVCPQNARARKQKKKTLCQISQSPFIFAVIVDPLLALRQGAFGEVWRESQPSTLFGSFSQPKKNIQFYSFVIVAVPSGATR